MTKITITVPLDPAPIPPPEADILCYSNNGLSFRWVPPDYSPSSNEVVSAQPLNADQLSAAFSGYKAAWAAANRVPLQIAAQRALTASDRVALRCLKSGVSFPAAWQAYNAALVAIVNGADFNSTSLPSAPAYPTGT